MKTTITTLIVFCSLLGKAQKNTVAAGGVASGTGGTVSFSIGQIDYKSNTGGGAVVLEGLQHPTIEVTLPVKLTRFAGACNNGVNVLNWETATEVNSDYFMVEKSGAAANWATLKSVPAAGQSTAAKSYTTTDEKPFDGATYYRLKMVDKDGKSAYSGTVAVTGCKDGKPGITVYPNPTTQGIYVSNANSNGAGQYEIYNATGQKVSGSTLPAATSFVDMQNLPAGTYYLKVTTGKAAVQTFTIVKK